MGCSLLGTYSAFRDNNPPCGLPGGRGGAFAVSDRLPVGVDLSSNELRESGSIRFIRSIVYTGNIPPSK